MRELGPGEQPPEITDENLAKAQGAVRFQQIQRYERMLKVVESRILADEEGTHPLDPRFLELGIRILKEEAALYRLGRALPVAEEEEDPAIAAVDRRQAVEARLQELEDKARAAEEGAAG
jgi:uncharacterized membrane protein YgaE (UPF0421/DUF939 family)